MTDRIAMVAADGTLPGDVSVPALANSDSSVIIGATGTIAVTSQANADSTVWDDPRRVYGAVNTATTPVPVIFEGGVETDGMVVVIGPQSGRTWGSHCFQAFDETGTYRLTLGIDEHDDPSIGFLQVWKPSEGTFGRVQVGSDYDSQGTMFSQYDIQSFGHLTFSGAFEGRADTLIAQSGSNSSITLRGGFSGNPTKGSFIQVRGGGKSTNPAGTVVNFGCTWLSDASLAGTALTFNYVSSTKDVDYAKITSTGQFEITTGDLRITTPKTPASATDTGSAGEVCWDTDYLYVCTATDTWKRAALSTWP